MKKKKTTKQLTEEHINILAWIITAIIFALILINIKYILAFGILFFICFVIWLIKVLF